MSTRAPPNKQLITAEVVAAAFERGVRELTAPPATTVVTPDAWSKAQELGLRISRAATSGDPGSCERATDPSGVVVVRGPSIALGHFTAAGPGRNVGLVDVITRQQGSPMTAGFMSFGQADAFPWRLGYDEIDYVLEGVLHITIDSRVVEGKAGDVLYVPKGSNIIFGTPNRTRVFYVTYPADWASAK